MPAPIYLPDQFQQLNENLLNLLLAKQRREAFEEDIKLRKADMKQRMEQYQAEQAIKQREQQEKQGPQIAAMLGLQQQLNQAQQGVSMGPGMPYQPTAPMTPELQQFAQMQGLPQSTQQGAAVGLYQAHQKRAEDIKQKKEVERYLGRLKEVMSPDEYGKFEAGITMTQNGIPKELVDQFMPLNALQKADLVLKQHQADAIKDDMKARAFASEALKPFGVNVPSDYPDGPEMLKAMVLAQQAARNAKDLAAAGRTAQAEGDLRKAWEASPLVKQAQEMAFSYNKIKELASQEPTGPSDQAIVYAFINMQDQTAARDAERKALQAAGSIEEYISGRFGKWKKGTVFAPSVREKILAAAETMQQSQKNALDGYTGWYTGLANDAGVDPAKVTYDPYNSTTKNGKKGLSDSEASARLLKAMGGK